MQIFLIIIHVIACLFLIAVILLQAGRGGGLSDIAGGSQAQSILGTETNTFMKRLTEIFAIVFIVTSLSLGIISTHRGKLLIAQKRMIQNLGKKIPIPVASPSAQMPSKEVVASPLTAGETKPAAVATTVSASSSATAPAVPAPAASAATEVKSPAEGNAK